MAIPDRSHQYGSIFGDWHIGQMLGTGSGGKSAVFSLYRDNNGWREYCALKVISLIEEQGRQESMPQFRRNEYSTAVREQQKHAELEIRLMDQVRGKTNIVTYLDHKFFNWHDRNGFGVDLLIRMEKLTDLRRQMRNGKCFSDSEIIRIGQDICQALVICHSKNILHRDIKPENIFISEDGDYKLGDFGISRILDGTASALASTGIGTMAYCAPEQFSGAYDRRVDIYSLGLVLYELANNNHLPFAQSAYAGQEAIQTRLSGKPLPSPGGRNPGSRLVQVILKACAHKPENRYASAEAMLQALNSLSGNTVPDSERTTNRISRSPSVDPEYPTNVIASGTFSPEQTTRMPLPEEDEKPSHRGAGFYLAIILPAVLGVVALIAVASILLFKPSHTHSYLDATCESPRICAECGETEGAALNHRWQDATCSTPRTCVDCGATSGKVLEHHWIDATCQSSKTCQVCGETTGDYGHQWQDATHKSPKTCKICGEISGTALTDPDQIRESIMSEAALLADRWQYRQAIQLLHEAWKKYGNLDYYEAAVSYMQQFGVFNTSLLSAGKFNTVLLNPDGTVQVCGYDEYGELSANNWTNIAAVCIGDRHIVGLRASGTVAAIGEKLYGKCDVTDWHNIIAISAGDLHTVALSASGEIYAEGFDYQGQCDADALMRAAGQNRIVAIAAGYTHTLALLENGRVISCGSNALGERNVSEWTDIVAIYAGSRFSAGLKMDGTVVVTGSVCASWDLSTWTDIVNLSAGDYYLLGLKADGTVVAVSDYASDEPAIMQTDVSGLTDIVFISAGHDHAVALTSDGTIVCVGSNQYGQCDFDGMTFVPWPGA